MEHFKILMEQKYFPFENAISMQVRVWEDDRDIAGGNIGIGCYTLTPARPNTDGRHSHFGYLHHRPYAAKRVDFVRWVALASGVLKT